MEQRFRNVATFSLVLLIFLTSFSVFSFPANAAWLSGFTYRKSHVITGAAGDGTDYQVKIVVHSGSGEDGVGEDVYLNGNSLNWPDDIRFVDNDETTELDHWLESSDASTATFWVEVKDDLGSDPTIYIYYGNSAASSASNGDNTFLFFDDFAGINLNTEKWTVDAVNNIDETVDDYFRFEDCTRTSYNGYWIYDGSDTGSQHHAKWTPTSSFAIEWDGSMENTNNDYTGQGGMAVVTTDNTIIYYLEYHDGGSGSIAKRPTVVTETDGWGATSDMTPASFILARDGNNYEAFVDGVSRDTYTSSSTVNNIALTAGGLRDHDYPNYVQIDYVLVRNYASPEPIHSGWGEETINPSISVGGWWDFSWLYRKEIIITENSGGELTDYSVYLGNPLFDETGLIAWWDFSEGFGSTAEDNAGNDNTGTLTCAGSGCANPDWIDGLVDGGVNFNRIDNDAGSYISTGEQTDFDLTDDLSIEAWFKLDSIGGPTYIENYFITGAGNDYNLRIYNSDRGNVIGFSAYTAAGGEREAMSTIKPTVGEWYHVVGTKDRSENRMVIYVNGETQPGWSATSLGGDTDNPFSIGSWGMVGGNWEFFDGVIDEVRVWDRVLSASEIKTIYSSTKTGHADIRFTDSLGAELSH